ncbi:MAG: hypothetical protein DYG98_22400 [Haliscomenobacteraceae bacterium CHB4]|nr:hypothetical protein [Saprospiraceae bacterium]MCE7925811.1 hypothetical protein [Haliscomenobacteraceae bacterium CHB4]
MEDVLLEQFLKGDPLLIRQLRPIILDFVTRTGGNSDDAREVFQIVSLSLFERAKRTPAQYISKAFKVWLNKHRRDPDYVSEQTDQLEADLEAAFAPFSGLLTALRKEDEAATDWFNRTGGSVLLPFVKAGNGDVTAAGDILAAALKKCRRVIRDFKDYFLKSCKNEWLRLKKKRGMISPEEYITHLETEDDTEADLHELPNLILNLFHKASNACRKLLHPLLFEGKTKDELLGILGYKNPGSFDVAKSRCLSALREELKQHPYFKPADV